MITLLADLVRRRVSTLRAAMDAHPDIWSRRPAPPPEILTSEQPASPNIVPHNEGRSPPTSQELTELFKEPLLALLIELAWRRSQAGKTPEENGNEQCRDLRYSSRAQSLRLRAAVNIH